MEPSKLAVALFLALALLLAQPSEAIRAQRVLNPAPAADDQQASSTNTDVAHPLTWPGFPNIPGFPPLPPLPPHPGCPPLPPIPGLPMPTIPGLPIPAVNPPPQSPPTPIPPPSTPLMPPPPAVVSTPPPSTPLTPPPPPASTPQPVPVPMPSAPAPPLQSGSPIPPSPTTPPPPSPPSQPKECLPSLMGLNPCMGYLTNTSVSSPPAACCAGFKSLVDTAPICLCHGLNGDISTLMPAPMDTMRMMSLPGTCNVPLPLQALAQCSSPNVPPLRAPAPAAPPSPKSSPYKATRMQTSFFVYSPVKTRN